MLQEHTDCQYTQRNLAGKLYIAKAPQAAALQAEHAQTSRAPSANRT